MGYKKTTSGTKNENLARYSLNKQTIVRKLKIKINDASNAFII